MGKNNRIEGGRGSMGRDFRAPKRFRYGNIAIGPAGEVEYGKPTEQQRYSTFKPDIMTRGMSKKETNQRKGRR